MPNEFGSSNRNSFITIENVVASSVFSQPWGIEIFWLSFLTFTLLLVFRQGRFRFFFVQLLR